MVEVADKVVVVTGGRRGLGAALVDEVLARGARKVYWLFIIEGVVGV